MRAATASGRWSVARRVIVAANVSVPTLGFADDGAAPRTSSRMARRSPPYTGARPAQLLEPRRRIGGRSRQEMVRVRPHEQTRRVEAARDHVAVRAGPRGVDVDVVPLRVEAAGECQHLVPIDLSDAEVEDGAGRYVVEEQFGGLAGAGPDHGRKWPDASGADSIGRSSSSSSSGDNSISAGRPISSGAVNSWNVPGDTARWRPPLDEPVASAL